MFSPSTTASTNGTCKRMVVNIVNVSKRMKREKGDEKDTSHQGLESLVLLVKSRKTVCVCVPKLMVGG